MPGNYSIIMAGNVLTPAAIPQTHRNLLTGSVFGVLTTMLPNGQPQSSMVWVDFDGTEVLINTCLERQKSKNMLANPKVTVLVVDPANPSRFIEVRGQVTVITTDGAIDHADRLTRRYTGKPHFYGDIYPVEKQSQETRVVVMICP